MAKAESCFISRTAAANGYTVQTSASTSSHPHGSGVHAELQLVILA